MKKIFPVITILVCISALGLIFFQYVWIKQALQDQEMQFEETMQMVTVNAAHTLIEEKSKMYPYKNRNNNDLLFPLNVFPNTIAHKFSPDEVRAIIEKAFEKNKIRHVNFEFAVVTTSMIGDELQSKGYFEKYNDQANYSSFIYPLDAQSGSLAEGLVPQELLVIVVPLAKKVIWRQMIWMILGAGLFTLIIFTAFFITIRALLNQKKLSEIKSDFINNMTHEFKTPLATISLAVDALKNEKVISDTQKIDYFTRIIKDENKRMNKQVETILQAALSEKQEVQLNEKPIHVHALILAALNNIELLVKEKDGTIESDLKAGNDCIIGDEVHFTNIIHNLLDNAVKYSKEEGLRIKLSTVNVHHYIRIKIEDNGIGMNKETVQRIFERFYRAHTGNIHNVKGFGLGLSYVKSIVEAHKGKIKAESTLGKGSCFIIDLPVLSRSK